MAKRKLVTKKSLRAGQTIYAVWLDMCDFDISDLVIRKIRVLPDTASDPDEGAITTAAPVSYIADRLIFQGVGCKFFHSRRKAISCKVDMLDA